MDHNSYNEDGNTDVEDDNDDDLGMSTRVQAYQLMSYVRKHRPGTSQKKMLLLNDTNNNEHDDGDDDDDDGDDVDDRDGDTAAAEYDTYDDDKHNEL